MTSLFRLYSQALRDQSFSLRFPFFVPPHLTRSSLSLLTRTYSVECSLLAYTTTRVVPSSHSLVIAKNSPISYSGFGSSYTPSYPLVPRSPSVHVTQHGHPVFLELVVQPPSGAGFTAQEAVTHIQDLETQLAQANKDGNRLLAAYNAEKAALAVEKAKSFAVPSVVSRSRRTVVPW